eukprot:scaffold6290_cov125-Isochrysis_galbana.AAC.8
MRRVDAPRGHEQSRSVMQLWLPRLRRPRTEARCSCRRTRRPVAVAGHAIQGIRRRAAPGSACGARNRKAKRCSPEQRSEYSCLRSSRNPTPRTATKGGTSCQRAKCAVLVAVRRPSPERDGAERGTPPLGRDHLARFVFGFWGPGRSRAARPLPRSRHDPPRQLCPPPHLNVLFTTQLQRACWGAVALGGASLTTVVSGQCVNQSLIIHQSSIN